VPDVAVEYGVADFGEHRRVALLGGIYSNYLALERALEIGKEARVEEVFALGGRRCTSRAWW
jgi:hypothetical protein